MKQQIGFFNEFKSCRDVSAVNYLCKFIKVSSNEKTSYKIIKAFFNILNSIFIYEEDQNVTVGNYFQTKNLLETKVISADEEVKGEKLFPDKIKNFEGFPITSHFIALKKLLYKEAKYIQSGLTF